MCLKQELVNIVGSEKKTTSSLISFTKWMSCRVPQDKIWATAGATASAAATAALRTRVGDGMGVSGSVIECSWTFYWQWRRRQLKRSYVNVQVVLLYLSTRCCSSNTMSTSDFLGSGRVGRWREESLLLSTMGRVSMGAICREKWSSILKYQSALLVPIFFTKNCLDNGTFILPGIVYHLIARSHLEEVWVHKLD